MLGVEIKAEIIYAEQLSAIRIDGTSELFAATMGDGRK